MLWIKGGFNHVAIAAGQEPPMARRDSLVAGDLISHLHTESNHRGISFHGKLEGAQWFDEIRLEVLTEAPIVAFEVRQPAAPAPG